MPVKKAPPVPTTNSRIPWRWSSLPFASIGAEALVVVAVSDEHELGAGVVEACQIGCMKVLLPSWPELNRGWCQ